MNYSNHKLHKKSSTNQLNVRPTIDLGKIRMFLMHVINRSLFHPQLTKLKFDFSLPVDDAAGITGFALLLTSERIANNSDGQTQPKRNLHAYMGRLIQSYL